MLRTLAGAALDLFLPPTCAVCGTVADGLCRQCATSLPVAPDRTPPPGVDHAAALAAHAGGARQVVAALKYQQHRDALAVLGPALAALACGFPGDRPEVVVWAATTTARRRHRGADQAELLARAVARQLGAPAARLVRAQFLSLREKEFVEAARALGASRTRQVMQHILPNALGPVIVAATIDVAAAIIAESTLSFLGLGFPPDIPTWGRLLADAKDYLDMATHWALAPGMAIFLTVLAINFIGDGLRDALDPRRVI